MAAEEGPAPDWAGWGSSSGRGDAAEDAAEALDSGRGSTQDASQDPASDVDKDAPDSEEHNNEDAAESSSDEAPAPSPNTLPSASGRRGSRGRGRVLRRDGLRPRSPKEDEEKDDSNSQTDAGLRLGLRILQDLLNTNSTFLHYPEAKKGMVDYHDVIEKPMWFEEVQRKFDDDEYSSIVDFVKDVRLILLNAYRYFGPDTLQTKRALRIEQVFENKLTGLPGDLRSQCLLSSTHGIETSKDEEDNVAASKTGEFFSYLLKSVSGDRTERENKRIRDLQELRQLDKEGRGKEILEWENGVLLSPPAITQMRTMWEIPLIGHLIQLTVPVLCIEQLPQYEIERMFLMPQASKSLAILMTSLLSPPIQRPKLNQIPPMPYSIWSRKLSQRVAVWYKMFQTRNHDGSKIFELCGIEKEFWNILGDWNQLEDYEYHELSFHQRVWLVKSLCDYLVHNHKTMQDALVGHSQKGKNSEFLGEDRHGRQYLHFPQLCSAPGLSTCVRVYRCVMPEERARTPDPAEGNSCINSRPTRRDYMPTWMRGRGRGGGKGKKRKQSLKMNLGAQINNLKFLSRQVYRMPNGMHIRGRRKRGTSRPVDGASSNARQEEERQSQQTPTSTPDSLTQPPDQSLDTDEKVVLSRQTRSTRKISQGFYADWSDSDSSSSSSLISKKPRQKRGSAPVSVKVKDSTNNNLKLRLTISRKQNKTSCAKNSDVSQSDNSDEDEITKSVGAEEDGSSHESAEENFNRSTGASPASEGKRDDDSDDDMKPETSEKKEETDFNITDDLCWMPTTDDLKRKNSQKRPHYNPEWLLLGAEHFELVADSVQGVRDLVESLCEENDDIGLLQRLKNQSSFTKPLCEEKLERKLLDLISDIDSLEVKMESNAQKLRWKLFEEWEEFKNRSNDGEAKAYWLSIIEGGMDIPDRSICQAANGTKEEGSPDGNITIKVEDQKGDESQPSEPQDDESQTGNELRHSLRTKKTKVDTPQQTWLQSETEDEESSEELDDVWEMPSRRRKRKSNPGRLRKNRKDEKSDDESEEKPASKKTVEKSLCVARNFSFESCGSDKEPSREGSDEKQTPKGRSASKPDQKMLPNKLTLDKEGNMFITLGCGTKVHLKKDEDGKIVVPEGHDGLSMINGKTLDQLLGSGKVVQNKNKKSSKKPVKRSTTLFPAVSQPTEIVQAKEWTPPVVKNKIQLVDVKKLTKGTSVQAKEWTPPLESSSSSTSCLKPGPPQVKTYFNRKKREGQKPSPLQKVVTPLPKKNTQPEEVVLLSDGSDDSIEVIKETEPKSSNQNAVPRIESVIGNATVDSFASKPLTKSVTMTPVVKKPTASSASKKSPQWSPVISNTVSLEPVSSTGRVPPPGAPQVVITPAKNVPARRNLQQTGVFHQPSPNQSFVPVNTLPMRQAQSQFVPVNQMVPVANQFQPTAQVVGLGNQYVVSNSQFSQMGNPYLINSAPTYQYVSVTPTPVPMPLPIRAFDVGLPPGLTGQIVLANGDNNEFSYAFKLDDGGLIFLSNEQVSKIRAANGGKLTTMVQFQTL